MNESIVYESIYLRINELKKEQKIVVVVIFFALERVAFFIKRGTFALRARLRFYNLRVRTVCAARTAR